VFSKGAPGCVILIIGCEVFIEAVMETREARQQIDKLLLPFIQATDEEDSQRLLTQLVSDHADPIIKSIVRRKLHLPLAYLSESRLSEDAEEISSEILVQVPFPGCASQKRKPGEKDINNFRSYVASITYRRFGTNTSVKNIRSGTC